jgi:membrane-bound serine protease (ClpP class)
MGILRRLARAALALGLLAGVSGRVGAAAVASPIAAAVGALPATPATPAAAATAPHVDVLTFSGTIDPVSADLMTSALATATRDGAAAFVLELDTPGGDLTSMRTIAEAFLNGAIPTIVYVAPSGARAGSAGTFVTYAAQLAGMAPGTEIGAASPVGAQGQTLTGTEATKITNDAIAMITAWAERNGRNATFAADAVRSAASLPAAAALQQHVVNAVAPNLPDLLRQLDGATVHLQIGDRTLHLAGDRIVDLPVPWWTQALLDLADPSLAYWLFTLGFWAIVIEFFHPTLIGGVAGAIAALLGLLGLEILSVSAVGVALLVVGLGLLVVDIAAPTHGVLTLGGLIAFVLGSSLLHPAGGLPLWAIILAAALCAALGLAVAAGALRLRKHRPIPLGARALLGQRGVVTATVHAREVEPAGQVEVGGTYWRAYVATGGEIPPGTAVEIVGVDPDLGLEVWEVSA